MMESSTGGSSGEAPFISDDALRLPSDWDAVLDVCFGGQWVWSISPPSRRAAKSPSRDVPWPPALRPYLDGHARITIREHISERVLLDEDHWFGSGDGEVRIVDAAGQPLSLDKNGDLQRAFDTGSAAMVDSLLDNVETLLRDLREACGIDAFVAFGALLGAVREGTLIGHDSDADLAYLSEHTHPLDVARESFHLRRVLRRHGYTISPLSAASFKTLFTDADGDTRAIDVFAGFIVDGDFYLLPAVNAPLPRSAILPPSEITLHGRRLPGPADPEALLEATYGESWRVPDPSFTFQPHRFTRQRLTGWVRGLRKQLRHWEEFYRGQDSAAVPDEPSAFAQWVHERESTARPLMEIGFGTGRDALWFAGLGYQVHGLEYAHSAVAHAREAADAAGLSARFEAFNLYELRQVLAMGARLAQDGTPLTLYGRFLVHALEDDGRQNLWRLAQMALRAGGLCYLEFRTGKDEGAEHAFGEHFRRFLEPDVLVDEIEACGGHIDYREEGHGLAVYQDEDPHVCRLAVRWSQ